MCQKCWWNRPKLSIWQKCWWNRPKFKMLPLPSLHFWAEMLMTPPWIQNVASSKPSFLGRNVDDAALNSKCCLFQAFIFGQKCWWSRPEFKILPLPSLHFWAEMLMKPPWIQNVASSKPSYSGGKINRGRNVDQAAFIDISNWLSSEPIWFTKTSEDNRQHPGESRA